MNQKLPWKRAAQLVVVLLCGALIKLYYSTASPDQLRWILAPTTVLVELVSRKSFAFESHAGYLSSDRSFLIAGSCAGVNFLITSFLMLSLRRLWKDRSQSLSWWFIPAAALFAYLATLVANTVRISTALMHFETRWLSPNGLHRFQGIFIYFGFLLLLFIVSERMASREELSSENAPGSDDALGFSQRRGARRERAGLLRQSLFPLLVYYATTLGIPLINGAYRPGNGAGFWEHSVFVLLTPFLLIIPLALFRFFRSHQTSAISNQ